MSLQAELHQQHIERRQRLGDGVFSKYAQTVHRLSEAQRQLDETQKRISEAELLLNRYRFEAAAAIALRPRKTSGAITVGDIIEHAAHFYSIEKMHVTGQRRTKDIVRVRQVAMYLAKSLTALSLPQIGMRFGGKDHTTVLHACRKIENLLGFDPELNVEISKIKSSLGIVEATP